MNWYRVLVTDAVAALDRLESLMKRGADHGVPLHASLAPGMFGFDDQVRIAAGFTLRGAFPLAGQDAPNLSHDLPLTDVPAMCRTHLATLSPDAFAETASRTVTERAGDAILTLDAESFVTQFYLPNLAFHMTCAYLILRHDGVKLSKGDFDGLHAYAPGFSFI